MNGNGNISQLRVGIIGIGPVGGVLAAHLAEAGTFVVPCDIISQKLDNIKKMGICLQNKFKKKIPVFDVSCSIKDLEVYNLDLVIFAVKTPVLKKIVGQIKEFATDKMYFLVAQNGIDNELIVADELGHEKTLRMVINYAGNMTNDYTVNVNFFNPPNYLAALKPQGEGIAQKLNDLLNSVHLDTEIPDNIRVYIWGKTILNASISSICAITRRTMKEVMDFPKTRKLVEAIIDESVCIAQKEGIDLGETFRKFCVHYLTNAGHHRPSMLIDLDNGLNTEIDQLNGKIVEYGKKHNTPTPLNLSVTALIHMLEHSREKTEVLKSLNYG